MKLGYLVDAQEDGGYFNNVLSKGFKELDISYEPYNSSNSYDYLIIFNPLSNLHPHQIPFLETVTGKFAFADFSDYGWYTVHGSFCNDYHSAFSPGSRSTRPPSNGYILNFLRGKSYPYFLRQMYKAGNYHKSYHSVHDTGRPYGFLDTKEPVTFEQFKNRELDVFVSWSPNHDDRATLTNILKTLPSQYKVIAKCEGLIYNHVDHCNHLSNCRLSLTYHGHTIGSGREYEVLQRCALLKNSNNDIFQPYPVVPGESCIEFQVNEIVDPKSVPRFESTNLLDVVIDALSNVKRTYDIYVNGFYHTNKYHTAGATAQYVLDRISQHDWNEVTPE